MTVAFTDRKLVFAHSFVLALTEICFKGSIAGDFIVLFCDEQIDFS